MTDPLVTVAPGERASARRWRRSRWRRERPPVGGSRTAGYFFVALYVAMLLCLGVAPTVYAISLALRTSHGLGVGNFVDSYHLPQFIPAFKHVLLFEAIWLVSQSVLVVALALMVHNLSRRVSATFRFIFYLPGAMAGAASVVIWLFMFTPTTSPFAFIEHALHYTLLANTVTPNNLPVLFAIMAFWTGAGGWIVVMHGALNNVPTELIEAAEIDGSNVLQTALRIKLPLIRKWVVYMLVLSFASGTQLFVEPQILGIATGGEVPPQWSPNQLAYYLAFQLDRFNEAAAISVDLLVLGLLVAVLIVWRGKLFEVQ